MVVWCFSRTLAGHTDSVDAVAIALDGNMTVSVSQDKTLCVWDVATGKPIAQLTGHTRDVRSVAFSPDGRRIASGSLDKTVRVWDSDSGECLETIEGTNDARAIAAGPASCPYRQIRRDLETVVASATSGEPIAWFPVALSRITTHPNGRKWAAAGATHVCILTLEGGDAP